MDNGIWTRPGPESLATSSLTPSQASHSIWTMVSVLSFAYYRAQDWAYIDTKEPEPPPVEIPHNNLNLEIFCFTYFRHSLTHSSYTSLTRTTSTGRREQDVILPRSPTHLSAYQLHIDVCSHHGERLLEVALAPVSASGPSTCFRRQELELTLHNRAAEKTSIRDVRVRPHPHPNDGWFRAHGVTGSYPGQCHLVLELTFDSSEGLHTLTVAWTPGKYSSVFVISTSDLPPFLSCLSSHQSRT